MKRRLNGVNVCRVNAKASDRAAWAAAHAAKALEVLLAGARGGGVPRKAKTIAAVDEGKLRAIAAADAAVGVHQHYDRLTGTDLAYVALNYANMIANASALVASAASAAAVALAGLPPGGAAGCPERNVSVCPATAGALRAEGGSVGVVLFNPLARARTEVVAVPVPVAGVEVVAAGSGAAVPHEVHPSVMADRARGLPFTLFIQAALQPFGPKAVTLRRAAHAPPPVAAEPAGPGGVVSLSVVSGASAAVDAATGSLLAIADQVGLGRIVALYYRSSTLHQINEHIRCLCF